MNNVIFYEIETNKNRKTSSDGWIKLYFEIHVGKECD